MRLSGQIGEKWEIMALFFHDRTLLQGFLLGLRPAHLLATADRSMRPTYAIWPELAEKSARRS